MKHFPNGVETTTKKAVTSKFSITERDGRFKLAWHDHVLALIKLPRYAPWFSAIDLVRANAETTINARCNSNTSIYEVADVIERCMSVDMLANQIFNQWYFEVGPI